MVGGRIGSGKVTDWGLSQKKGSGLVNDVHSTVGYEEIGDDEDVLFVD